MSGSDERHFENSTYREKIIEHLFVGELLRYFWVTGLTPVEILRPEVDAAGYDLVIAYGMNIRHVQLKTSLGIKANQKINAGLTQQPGGCVVWIVVNDKLDFQQFLWFGSLPNQPLPSLDAFNMAKHTRANVQGIKLLRKNTKVVSKREFHAVTMPELVKCLFGDFAFD